ncbi:hypothetical protein EMPS_07309 [Entomortierella parvispora]|uniref:Uncharacterized protein n=1 Tax=Entomortierella parvispora TaxID=205924 RepID=A0A9P3LY20_9FUNG|nr:hypothetical protein EMPS_07309 [Entomortierella parvispora]
MEQDSAMARFFAIPELQHLLGQNLPIHTLSQLVRTNKASYAMFTPILWQSIPRQLACEVSLSPLLSTRVHLIQSMDLSDSDYGIIKAMISAMEDSVELRRRRQAAQAGDGNGHSGMGGLRFLTFTGDNVPALSVSMSPMSPLRIKWSRKINEMAIALLHQTPFLTHLSVPSNVLGYEPKHLNRFLNALTFSLPRLQSLVISTDSGDYVSLESSLVLVERCLELPHLTTLSCKFEPKQTEDYPIGGDRWRDLFAHTLDQLRERLSYRRSDKLKILQLPCTIWPLDFLVPFFEDCVHDLETLGVPFFDESIDNSQWRSDDLCKALQSSCPGIKKVNVPSYTQAYPRGDFLALAVESVLKGCASKDKIGTETGLHSLVFINGDMNWDPIGSALEPHLETLEELTSYFGGQHFTGLGLLVQRCENLKVLNMNWCFQISGGYPLEQWPDTWACQGLRKLCVQIAEPAHEKHPPLSKEARQKRWHHLKRFYKAIGQLETLEELTLGYGSLDTRANLWLPDLMLISGNVEGCLGYLTRWTRLRRLRLMHDFWSRMGHAEVTFMAEHWPQLKDITFRTSDVDWQVKFIRDMHCWQVLKGRLPDLTFTILKS